MNRQFNNFALLLELRLIGSYPNNIKEFASIITDAYFKTIVQNSRDLTTSDGIINFDIGSMQQSIESGMKNIAENNSNNELWFSESLIKGWNGVQFSLFVPLAGFVAKTNSSIVSSGVRQPMFSPTTDNIRAYASRLARTASMHYETIQGSMTNVNVFGTPIVTPFRPILL